VIDVSLSDVPGIPVTVLFTGGCNFNCAYCHNSELIPQTSGTEMPVSRILQKIRGHMTDGYCVTGGEPTIHRDLPDLLSRLRKDGEKHINLNTQGSVPVTLERCLRYLDSVWFDLKAAPSRYPEITGAGPNTWSAVRKSISAVMASGAMLWPRTTYAAGLMVPDDIRIIAQELASLGFKGQYLVQNYVPSAGVRPDSVSRLRPPDRQDVESLRADMPSGITLKLDWR